MGGSSRGQHGRTGSGDGSSLRGGSRLIPASPAAVRRPVSTFWLDESGAKISGGRRYVVAGVKTRNPDVLQRRIHAARDKNNYHSRELKFSKISSGNVGVFRDVIDVLEDSDARIVATVIEPHVELLRDTPIWAAYPQVVCQLVQGNLTRDEQACVFVDQITTPQGFALGQVIKRQINGQLSGSPITLAVTLDSRANDLLQAADLVAGAIRHFRDPSGTKPEKARVVQQLALAFGLSDLNDQRSERVNILTPASSPRMRKEVTENFR